MLAKTAAQGPRYYKLTPLYSQTINTHAMKPHCMQPHMWLGKHVEEKWGPHTEREGYGGIVLCQRQGHRMSLQLQEERKGDITLHQSWFT